MTNFRLRTSHLNNGTHTALILDLSRNAEFATTPTLVNTMSGRPSSTHKTTEMDHPTTRKDVVSPALQCSTLKDDPLTEGQYQQLGKVRKDLLAREPKTTAAGVQSVEMQSALYFAFTNFRKDIKETNAVLTKRNLELTTDLNHQDSRNRELRLEIQAHEATIRRLEEEITWLKQYLPPPERTVIINFKGNPPKADVGCALAALATEPCAAAPAATAEPPPKRSCKIKSTVVDPRANASKPDEAVASSQKDGRKSKGHSSNPFHKVLDQLDRHKKDQQKEPRNDEEQKSERRRSAEAEESEEHMDF